MAFLTGDFLERKPRCFRLDGMWRMAVGANGGNRVAVAQQAGVDAAFVLLELVVVAGFARARLCQRKAAGAVNFAACAGVSLGIDRRARDDDEEESPHFARRRPPLPF